MEITREEIEKRIRSSYELPYDTSETVSAPLVTVRTITYQHAPYIADCIHGVLMQKTDFPVEYIIGEDFSTDGTRETVFEYAGKYPGKIRVITADCNVGGTANAERCNRMSRGKYIALCEGDDYWTDPYKLQIQADFLEAHPEYGLVYTDYDISYEKSGQKTLRANADRLTANSVSSRDELFHGIVARKIKIRTLTVMFRRELLDAVPPNDRQFPMGDTPLWLDLATVTKFHYIDRVTGVYRKRRNSASHPGGRAAKMLFKLSSAEMRIYYCKKYKYPVPYELQRSYTRELGKYLFLNPFHKAAFPVIDPARYLKLKLWISGKLFPRLIKRLPEEEINK